MGINLLSDIAKQLPPVAADPLPAVDLTALLAAAAPTLQRLTYHHLGAEMYRMVASLLGAYFAGLRCWQVSGLEKVVGLPIAGPGVMGKVGENGVQRGEPCEALLVLHDEDQAAGVHTGVEVVFRKQRRLEKLRWGGDGVQNDDDDSYQLQEAEDSNSEDGSDEQAVHRAKEVSDGDGAAATSQAEAGAVQGEGQANTADQHNSADLYVVKELGQHQLVANEFSKLFQQVCSVGCSSSRRSKGQAQVGSDQKKQAACAKLQQEVVQLIDRLLLAQVGVRAACLVASIFLCLLVSLTAAAL